MQSEELQTVTINGVEYTLGDGTLSKIGEEYGSYWVANESFGIATAAFLIVLISTIFIGLVWNMVGRYGKDLSDLKTEMGKLRGEIKRQSEAVSRCETDLNDITKAVEGQHRVAGSQAKLIELILRKSLNGRNSEHDEG